MKKILCIAVCCALVLLSIYLEDKGYRGSFAAAGIVVLEIALAYLFNRCGFEPAEYHWM